MVDGALWEEFKKQLETPSQTASPKESQTVGAEMLPALWAKEAWETAKTKGVLDGTRPGDAVTRQELAVVLQRLKLI